MTKKDDAYDVEWALNIARLWRAGKMIGGDEDMVRNALLDEIERLKTANAQMLEHGREMWADVERLQAALKEAARYQMQEAGQIALRALQQSPDEPSDELPSQAAVIHDNGDAYR